jgi:hypothetical protein
MTKEEIIKELDIQDNDKIYFFRQRQSNKGIEELRCNLGFNIFELICHLERMKLEIIGTLNKQIPQADEIKRKAIKTKIEY